MTTQMRAEALQAPDTVADLLAQDQDTVECFAGWLRSTSPTSLLTVARGSSDHAAHFMAYLIMACTGRLVTSLPMSLITLYQSKINCDGLVSMAFLQSGQSPDLALPTRFFAAGGACTTAFVNDPASPLALASRWVFLLHAGAETSVAATKSFIAQLVAGARLFAAWQDDAALRSAVAGLPEVLARAAAADRSPAVEALADADRLFVIGRGTGQVTAQEAALKFKETCQLQAEAFSGAEVQHGPMALVRDGFPMLIFAPRGPAQAGLLQLADETRARGGWVLVAAPAGTKGASLPLTETGAVDLDPTSCVLSVEIDCYTPGLVLEGWPSG